MPNGKEKKVDSSTYLLEGVSAVYYGTFFGKNASSSPSSFYNHEELSLAKKILLLTNNNLQTALQHMQTQYSQNFKDKGKVRALLEHVKATQEDSISLGSSGGYGSCG